MSDVQVKQSDPQFLVGGDLLSILVLRRLNLRPSIATVILVVALQIPFIIAAFQQGSWISRGGQVGLLDDYGYWIFLLTSIPATVYFFFWLPIGIADVLNGLQQNRVVGFTSFIHEDEVDLDESLARFARHYLWWGWAVLCLVSVAVLVLIAVIPTHSTYHTWINSGKFVFWYYEFTLGFEFWLGLLSIVRVLIAIYWFNRLFNRFPIDVQIMHPDGAGGLGMLGSFSTKLGYLIGVYGIAVVSMVFLESYRMTGNLSGIMLNSGVLILMGLYFILAPIAFFAPLGSAHGAMKTEKQMFLARISQQFETDFGKAQELLNCGPDELQTSLRKIEQLEKMHSLVSKFPVWPFNSRNVVRFGSAVLFPILLALFPTIINLLLGSL